MHRKIRIIAVLFCVLLQFSFLAGCKSNSSEEEDLSLLTEQQMEERGGGAPVINEDAINEIISSFSSPVEMAALMNSLEIPFSKKYIINPSLTENYDTNNKKAFALGVLSADLGYLNVYERASLIVEYLSAIKRLSDDLKVSQFFDFQSFKRIVTSNENIDSLLFLSVQSFRDMDAYLRESNRSKLSLLVITGVWIEGLYLQTQVAQEKSVDALMDRIGEQKILFNMLYPILKVYDDDPYFKELVEDFKDYQQIFEKVEISYQVADPETEIIDGHVTIIQNETSVVEIHEEQLEQITNLTKKIRNKLINL